MSPDGRDPAGSPDRDDPRYFDSHCHLTDDRLAGDRAEVIEHRAGDAALPDHQQGLAAGQEGGKDGQQG